MYKGEVTRSIIRIVGLLGDLPKNSFFDLENLLLSKGYTKERFPIVVIDGKVEKDLLSENFLKDYFYPDFRNIMFLEHAKIKNTRLFSDLLSEVSLVKNVKSTTDHNIEKKIYSFRIAKSEVFLFPGHIGLFSLSIELDNKYLNYQDINDILYLIRQFDTLTDQNIKWHEWISSNVLGGIQLRGENIKADEFSGSKFKLYTIIDCAVDLDERAPLLYDMSTVSTLGSSISTSLWAPSKQYYDELMGTKISFFNNWDAICLFDSFTCIGTGQLNNEGSVKSWDYTYFRIYLYRLFFKYNLYRYNSSVQDDPVKLRNEFESFLSDYNLSNISFNFMANEIFNKTGDALDITLELDAFQSRINRLSTTIQEKKQSKTNNLLKIVTFLGALSSIQPFLILLDPLKNYLNLSSVSIYSILILLILTLSLGVLYYLMPELFQQFGNRVKKIWK